MMTRYIFAIGLCAIGLGTAPWAQDSAPSMDASDAQCELKGQNGMVTMLLCPEGLSAEDMAEEGRIACGERKPCGAWIWTEETAIPKDTPASHDELPKESVQKALAIWVNEAERLVSVSKTSGN